MLGRWDFGFCCDWRWSHDGVDRATLRFSDQFARVTQSPKLLSIQLLNLSIEVNRMDTNRPTEPRRRQPNGVINDPVSKDRTLLQGALHEYVRAHYDLRDWLSTPYRGEIAEARSVGCLVSVLLVLHDKRLPILHNGEEEDGGGRLVERRVGIGHVILLRLPKHSHDSALDLRDRLVDGLLLDQPVDCRIELLQQTDIARAAVQNWLIPDAGDLVDLKDCCVSRSAVRGENNPVGAAYGKNKRQQVLLKTLFEAYWGNSL